jgi:hypothetical protein
MDEKKIVYKNNIVYLTSSIIAIALILVLGCIVFFKVVKFSLVFSYLYFLFGVCCIAAPRIAIKECTSLLVIDNLGVETKRSLKNIKMQWTQIVRIEYCGTRRTLNERIVLHSEKDQKIFVSLHRKNYLEAFQVIVSECRKRNPGVLIDKDLVKRLDGLK